MRVNNRQVYNCRTMKKLQNPDWDVVWVGMGGVLHKLPLSISCLPRLTAPPSPPPAYTMDSTQNLHFHFLPIWPLLIYKVVWFPTTDQALENLKIMSMFPFYESVFNHNLVFIYWYNPIYCHLLMQSKQEQGQNLIVGPNYIRFPYQ